MSKYEYRFVVDGKRNEDGDITFTIDYEALDEIIWDNEEQEWHKWDDDLETDEELIRGELWHRLQSPQVSDRETLP